jgi:hypothetical protein
MVNWSDGVRKNWSIGVLAMNIILDSEYQRKEKDKWL